MYDLRRYLKTRSITASNKYSITTVHKDKIACLRTSALTGALTFHPLLVIQYKPQPTEITKRQQLCALRRSQECEMCVAEAASSLPWTDESLKERLAGWGLCAVPVLRIFQHTRWSLLCPWSGRAATHAGRGCARFRGNITKMIHDSTQLPRSLAGAQCWLPYRLPVARLAACSLQLERRILQHEVTSPQRYRKPPDTKMVF
ncbi:hypothetical protein NDU88_009811 [Pleurodeles waltl]|uniref:Uncharacterized protein n=1 Tax=Pleurodeles waltl TaxID=8319 RepID=A0AAV7RX63_PLEWA|nr:hypothetical protein NDU88_009811 [Pleurodeles waltl]